MLSGPAGNGQVPDDPAVGVEDDWSYDGLRLGLNLSLPLWQFVVPDIYGAELVGDFKVGPGYFGVAEAGYSVRNLDEPSYRLEEKGLFLRIGGDRSFYQYNNDIIGAGARLGFSVRDRSASDIFVEQEYWGDYSGVIDSGLSFRQWAEVVLVIKAELSRNLFLGWNLRGKVLLFDRGDSHMSDVFIPGFGAGDRKSTLGFDFYIYYRFGF
ncbi:MAG: hypothetical protein EA408_10480 [Marinilabiliales bacterium]|nr:MAG: hypothetical protein EA408_10480 [Marinilabiliales bacterium]